MGANQALFPIATMARVLGVSKAGYYARIVAETDAEYANDNQALAAADHAGWGMRAEIWSGSRYVGTVTAPSDN
jgi:hypothetical protein